jgi:hypothetical protein
MMNAGTAVFLIVLVLIGSFAGLGYLINQNVAAMQDRDEAQSHSSAVEAANASLQQQLAQSQAETASEREAKEAAYSEARRLQAQVTELTEQLNQCNLLQGQASVDEPVEVQAQTPSTPNQAVEPAAPAAQSGSGSNTITWLMLATVFITMVTGWGVVLRTVRLSQPERTHRPQPATEQPLTIRMTREQMQEYVAWKRQQK